MSYILISNDDGYDAPGLRAMIDCVARMGLRVVAVAPDGPRSAQSSAITVGRALHIRRLPDYNGAEMCAVDGTPVDCVKLAVDRFGRPDFVFGGINHGPNDGNSVVYSGTMGVVIEGCMLGIPSVGFSHISHSWDTDFTPYKPLVERIAAAVVAQGLPEGVCLNVNMPEGGEVKGAVTVRAAKGYWVEEFDEYDTADGGKEYKLTGRFHNLEPDNDETDKYWLERGYASIVPVRPDMSAVDAICAISELILNNRQ